jgi:putative DNA primase/helicase
MSDDPKRPHLRVVSSIREAEILSAEPAPQQPEQPHAAASPAPSQGFAGSEGPDGHETGLGGGGGGAGSDDPGDDDLEIECGLLARTDLGNAQRFIRRHGENFLYVPEWGWLAWDGKRWNGKEADAILSIAVHKTIKAIVDEAEAIKGSRYDYQLDPVRNVWLSDKIRGWCLASQSASHIQAVARLAQAYLTASSDSFDADPMAFNVENGTLRFEKRDDADYVSFHKHRRSDRMTKIAPVIFDPKAQCPTYDKFLERVQPDESMRRHLHAWGGISLTALQLARLSFWYGTGRNGKSVCIDAWSNVMGDYSQTIPIESFLDQGRTRRGGEASPDIAALPGVRCLRTSEPEKGSKLAEGLVKLVTGGEPLRARHLNRDFFEFRPSFKLTMQGNYRPRIDGTDEGIWQRILLVPWGVYITPEERDESLPEKLKGEASGILNRLLDGLRDYLDHGLSPNTTVIEATADYREDSDPIGRFLADCTLKMDPPPPDKPGEEYRVAGNDIFALYKAWCRANGERIWSPKAFSRGLQDHGIVRLKSSGIFYRHLRLIKAPRDFEGLEYDEKDIRT